MDGVSSLIGGALVYRLYRLRRVITIAILIALTGAVLAYAYSGSLSERAVLLAILAPLLHVIRYPGVWHETLNLSFVLAVLIFLTVFLQENGFAEDAGHVLLIFFVGAGLFLLLGALEPYLLSSGPQQSVVYAASDVSHLDIATLRERILPRPGADDPMAIWGPENIEGFFSYTLKFKRVSTFSPKVVTKFHGNLARAKEDTGNIYQAYRTAKCKIMRDERDYYALVMVFPVNGETLAFNYQFVPEGTKTRVNCEENSIPMTWFLRFGMWVEDVFADNLTCKIDLAEARANRSIRLQPLKMFVLDIASLLPQDLPGPDQKR